MEEKNVRNLFPETEEDTSSKLNTEGLDAEATETGPAAEQKSESPFTDPQSDETDTAPEEELFEQDWEPDSGFDESRWEFGEDSDKEYGDFKEESDEEYGDFEEDYGEGFGDFEEESAEEEDGFEDGSDEEVDFEEGSAEEGDDFEDEPSEKAVKTSARKSASSGMAASSKEAQSSEAAPYKEAASETGSSEAVFFREAASAGTASGAAEKKELENTLEQVRSKKKAEGKGRAATYQEKILRHQRRRNRRTIFLVMLVTLALAAAVILWMRRGYTHAELKRIAVLSADDGAGYANLGGNVVQYGNNGAVCIDQRGDTRWSVSYEMQQPVTSVSGNVIAIGNRGGYYVYIMNTDGLIGTIQTILPIHNVAAAANGEVAVIMNDTKATLVRLYSSSGKEIANLVRTIEENGYPISAAVSPDGETLCLASVQMSNENVKSIVSFYNFGKAGKKTSDHMIDNPTNYPGEVVPYVYYIDNSTCVSVSDRRISYYRKSRFRAHGSEDTMFTDPLQGVFSSDSFIGLLFTETKEDSQYRLDIYNKRGKKAGSLYFSIPYSEIVIEGDKVYICNEQECQIYTIGGRCLFKGETDRAIRAIIPGTNLSDLMVVTEGEVDRVRLH